MKSYISKIAHQKWELAGKPHGRDLEFWLEAEKAVKELTAFLRTVAKESFKLPICPFCHETKFIEHDDERWSMRFVDTGFTCTQCQVSWSARGFR